MHRPSVTTIHNIHHHPFISTSILSLLDEQEFGRINGHRSDFSEEDKIPFHSFLEFDDFQLQSSETLPAAVNWVTAGAVTSVKNQGSCGCCWTIATVGSVEGIMAIRSNFTFLESLSFQQIISCDNTTGQKGCGGGSLVHGILWAEGSDGNVYGGLASDTAYPFTDASGVTTTECLEDKDPLVVNASETGMYVKTYYPQAYEARVAALKGGLARQPVAVLMRANCPYVQHYSHGVMVEDPNCECGPRISGCIDHAVLMVGYNDTDETPYFLVKNSWGAGWGEEGYFRVAQNYNGPSRWGLFGIVSQATAPLYAENLTAQEEPAQLDLATTAGTVTSAAGIFWGFHTVTASILSALAVFGV